MNLYSKSLEEYALEVERAGACPEEVERLRQFSSIEEVLTSPQASTRYWLWWYSKFISKERWDGETEGVLSRQRDCFYFDYIEHFNIKDDHKRV